MEDYEVKRAFLSVYEKKGIVEMASILHDAHVELLSSGGTAKAVRDAGIPITDVAKFTQYKPMFDHRVVTLHPRVHGGILMDRNDPEHQRDANEYNVKPIDLVVVNMYPADTLVGKEDVSIDEVVKLTDIGGPALIRGAAKNHAYVTPVIDPADYIPVAQMVHESGSIPLKKRQELAMKVFKTTAAYDMTVAGLLEKALENEK